MKFDSIALRNAFGLFTTGVTIITANPNGYKPFGVTANSFSSLSLDPPLLLWSLQKDSDTWDAFQATTQFAVNILASDQKDMSVRYAQKGDHELATDEYEMGESGCAILSNCIASFECDMGERYEGGDHIIMVGKVLEVNCNHIEASPLVFQSGQYRSLA
ncbi:MAG: flavin reductase family protein [Pseudomonadales bacterium]